jgi:T5SS/PEP-CTERM-associated repeat protein
MKRPHTQKRFFISVILVFSLVAGSALPAYAAPANWTGANSQDWTDDGNWIFSAPGMGDSANVGGYPGGDSPLISAPGVSLDSLNIGDASYGFLGVITSLSTNSVTIGSDLSGDGNVSLVTGDGVWTNAGTFMVGDHQGEGTLNVSLGAQMSSGHFFVGSSDGQGTVTVKDADSLLDVGGDLSIGVINGTGEMTISDGATLKTGPGRNVIIGDDGGTGTLTITGVGSGLSGDHTNFLIGDDGGTGTMNVFDGAFVEVGGMMLGQTNGSTGYLTVDGSAQMINYDLITIGEKGIGVMLVDHSASMTSLMDARVGNAAGGDGTVTLQRGGAWDVAGKLIVGAELATGLVHLNEGVLTTAAPAYLGMNGGSGRLTMENVSTYTSNAEFFVGYTGTGVMEVLSGSTADFKGDLHVGAFDTDSDGSLVVSGVDSKVYVSGTTSIGANGGTGVFDLLLWEEILFG